MIDTHCHIDLYNRPEKILQECEKADMIVLAMTNLPSHFEMGHPHVLPFNKIRLALGMHPLHAKEHNKEFPKFLKNLSKTSYIGEIGLDYSREGYPTKDIQFASFNKILKALYGQKKILSLHSRRAENEVFCQLVEKKIKGAIFHWYSGPISLIHKIANAGYYFSINPGMINSENGRKIISTIPWDKVLPETDGPFTEVDGRQTKPTDIAIVYQYFERLWDKTDQEVKLIISANFQRLLSTIK